VKNWIYLDKRAADISLEMLKHLIKSEVLLASVKFINLIMLRLYFRCLLEQSKFLFIFNSSVATHKSPYLS